MAEEHEEEEHAFLALELSQQETPANPTSQVNPKLQHSHSVKWTRKTLLLLLLAAMLVLLFAASAAIFLRFHRSFSSNATATATARSIRNGSHSPAFHFQPPDNLRMQASNAAAFYGGFYHLFYGFAVSSTAPISSWGHAASKDLLHWIDLPAALEPGDMYDKHGILGGSITVLPDQGPIILYTGLSRDGVATQNAAVPADRHDPMLKRWKKLVRNLVAMLPPGIEVRDPSTAWKDQTWRVVFGGRNGSDGVGFVYSSSELAGGEWKRLEKPLLRIPGSGIFESPDFFPVSSGKYVFKASLSDDPRTGYGSDRYSIGTYFPENGSFVPDVDGNASAAAATGFGARYDHGDSFFASKTFMDAGRDRRVLLALIPGDSTLAADVQAIPRKLWLGQDADGGEAAVLLQLPVDEVQSLRTSPGIHKSNVTLDPGAVIEVGGGALPQLDAELAFELPEPSMQMSMENFDVEPGSSTGNAAAHCRKKGAGVNGILGPFGLLVLATGDRAEQTAVFFHLGRSRKGPVALVCADLSRSSLLRRPTEQDQDPPAALHGAFVHLADPSVYRGASPAEAEVLELRLLVDNSVLEAFAQGGKVSITSRVYPTLARGDAARVFLFNNGTTPVLLKRHAACLPDLIDVKRFYKADPS